jgi:hypothetical protein
LVSGSPKKSYDATQPFGYPIDSTRQRELQQ